MSTEKKQGGLAEKLLYNNKSIFELESSDERARMMEFAEDYKYFLDRSKTEREATEQIIMTLDAS